MTTGSQADSPFRFYDNREKYLLFVNTCNEKQAIAERVAMDTTHVRPIPPAFRLFDAGMGDATVLTRVMRHLHHRYPIVPFQVVAKEISYQDVRISLDKMADRFHEHPLTVLVLTNMTYSEAPRLFPRSKSARERLNWQEVQLEGDSAFAFDEQIRSLGGLIDDWWQTRPSKRTGNPLYKDPSVLVIYRKDHQWPLASAIPQKGDISHEYDIVIAAQPFRARMPADLKVRNVLAPLARSLAPFGCMAVVQSTGKDPGMEIIRRIWPDESPFQTPRQVLLRELRTQLQEDRPDLRFIDFMDSRSLFRYFLQVPPDEVTDRIGTSALLAAWNAATYVAQIDDERVGEAMSRHGEYLDVTRNVLETYQGLWFTDESFLVTRVNSG
ncbi:MAG: hypothetical protein FI707_12160 [SAR202 cluster bacterium]|nr:hypothetical protein [SAR202 cluster bacterium]